MTVTTYNDKTPSTPTANPLAGNVGLANGTRTYTNHHAKKSGPNSVRIISADPVDIKYHETVDKSIDDMHDNGFVVFKSLLDAEGTQRLRGLMDEVGGDYEQFRGRGHYGKTSDADMEKGNINKHVGCPFALMPEFLEYMDKGESIEVIQAIHGPGTRVIGGSVWVTGPGRYPMALHVDYQPFGLPEDIAMDKRVKIPIMISTLHYYLNDMYAELGPTVVVPGSHRAGRAPDGETGWNGNEAQAFQCKAGDAMLFRSDLWHGAMPNCSDEMRYMLQVHYGNPYINSTFDGWHKKRELCEETRAQASERQRNLMGERQGDEPGSYLVHDFVRPEDRKAGVHFS